MLGVTDWWRLQHATVARVDDRNGRDDADEFGEEEK